MLEFAFFFLLGVCLLDWIECELLLSLMYLLSFTQGKKKKKTTNLMSWYWGLYNASMGRTFEKTSEVLEVLRGRKSG